VDEVTTLAFTATATDLNQDTLTFSLDPGAPPGAGIGPAAGVFTWTPGEAQGPGDYAVTVRVTDDGTPALDDSEAITITVREVNAAPVLGPIGDRTVVVNGRLVFTATASDGDVPSNTLTFSLDPGAPFGAIIHPVTGVFMWMPITVGTYTVTVRVTDDASPTLDDWETITIAVVEWRIYLPLVCKNYHF